MTNVNSPLLRSSSSKKDRGFGSICRISSSSFSAGTAAGDDLRDVRKEEDVRNESFATMINKKKKYIAIALALMPVAAISIKAGYASGQQEQQKDVPPLALSKLGALDFDPLETFDWQKDLESNNWDYNEQMQNMEMWKHPPANGGEKFTVCFKDGDEFTFFGSYIFIHDGLQEVGMCVKDVKVNANIDDPSCDVRMFRNGQLPEVWPKTNPKQVDIYFTHESPSMYSPELLDEDFRRSFDYVANYERTSGLWFPFAVPVPMMMTDFPLFTMTRKERIPGIGWLARDCMSNRAETLRKISAEFPVFSVGKCARNVKKGSFPESVMELPKNDTTSIQEPMSNFMFYYAEENAGVSCPEYVTEKIYYALSRGSIPIYIGWEGVNELLPSPDSWIDLRNYATPQQLAKRLREIAESDEEWEKMHKWRYEDPKTWPKLYQKAVRQQTEDSKYALCALLQNGESDRRRRATKEPILCDQQTEIFGQYLKLEDQTGSAFRREKGDSIAEAIAEANAETKMYPWEKHLKKNCDTDNSCFEWIK